MILSRLLRVSLAAITLALFALAPLRAGADGVLIFAAASLKNALDEIAPAFEAQTGQEITVSYAASSVLARQIQLGAPADVFLSANVEWMDVLQDKGLIKANARVDLLGNGLVLIGGSSAPDMHEVTSETDLVGALAGGHLAMALVDAVPAGIYGKAALRSLGLWDGVEGQVAQTDNVRAALALVAAGAAPLGIVYRSDAVVENRVRVLAEFAPDLHPAIIYPAGVTTSARPGSLAFLEYLQSPEAQDIFQKQGFSLPGH
jgi:molybdate transport system substrate-binding protein